MRTIILDDDEDILTIYNDYLNEMGLPDVTLIQEPQSFFDSHSIEELVEEYDLVICDLHMPKIQGNAILKNFVTKRVEMKKNTKFIIVTGVGPDYFTRDKDGWGSIADADDILGKPVNFTEFQQAIQNQGFEAS